MRNTSLKRTKRGYVRNLGWRSNAKSEEKFYLGHDRELAVKRLEVITTLWAEVEVNFRGHDCRPFWDESRLQAAKAIAKGQPMPNIEGRPPGDYYRLVQGLSRIEGEKVEPANRPLYDWERGYLRGEAETYLSKLPEATGQTLHQALEAYQTYIEREFKDQVDGTITDNGKTKVNQIKTILRYVPDADLASLDYAGTDEVFGIFRRRPISKRYKRPMRRKSCSHYIGELGRFFQWLHLSNDYLWRKPEDFELIKRSPRETDEDAEQEAADIPMWTVEQLKTINEYATPIERIFFLLGINCAYGADQAGRLRIRHLKPSSDDPKLVRRLRRKKKTYSVHLLWTPTREGLKWALERRGSQHADADFLLLTDNNLPYWRKTKGGNRAQAIPRLWSDLLKRIRKDKPDFPKLPFNSLRDTSGDMIRKLAGAEIASLHLAHKHQSKDENLNRYTNPLRKKHFNALRRLAKKLEPVFDAAGSQPWKPSPKTYIGKAKIKKLLELRQQNVRVPEIAKKLKISVSTIYRQLAAFAERSVQE